MLNNFIDIAYILKLKKNPMDSIQTNIISKVKKYYIYEVDGIKMNNEGNIDISLFTIMTHNHINAVSLDITKNFINMIKHAYLNNYSNVLFLEEDAEFDNIDSSKIEKVESWLSQNYSKWDIFYLGYCNWPYMTSFMINPNIVKVSCPLLAHSFILNKSGMEKILNYTEYGQKNMNHHFDKILGSKINSLRKFAIFPMISFQHKNPALLQKALDKMNINLSMKSICKCNEIISILFPLILIIIFVFYIIKLFF
jgi:hypothetical protein